MTPDPLPLLPDPGLPGGTVPPRDGRTRLRLESSPLLRAAGDGPSWLTTGLLLTLTLLLAALTLTLVNKLAPSLPLAVAGGVGLVALVALAVGRYEAAVALGFLLSGVVKIEPAPPDGIFAVVIAVALVTNRFRSDRIPAPVVVLLGLLAAVSILSFAAAISVPAGVRFVAITLYLFVFAAWLTGYVDRERRARQIVIAWLAIAVFSAILGTLALQFPGFPAREQFIADGASRASALFKDPNVFGPFLVPIAVILLEEMISPRLLRLRPATGLLLLTVLCVGLIYSFSRAAWANMLLSTAVMLMIVLVRRQSGPRFLTVLSGLGLVAMAVMAFVVFSGQADFIGQRAQLQGYDTERFGAQRFGIQLAGHYPLGVGPDQFIIHHPIEAHSTYVRVLAEQGVVGLVLWLALVLFTLGLALSNALAGRSAAGIGSAALLGAWCGLLFNSVVVDTLHWRHLWVVAALIWAAALVGRRGDATPAPLSATRRRALAPPP